MIGNHRLYATIGYERTKRGSERVFEYVFTLKATHTGHCPELVGAFRAEKERPFTLWATAIR